MSLRDEALELVKLKEVLVECTAEVVRLQSELTDAMSEEANALANLNVAKEKFNAQLG